MLQALFRASLLALIASSAHAQARSLDWEPSRTWVFVVGTLEWQDAETFDPFPEENRRDLELVELFRTRGVSSERIVYLQDQGATGRAIRSQLQRLLAKTKRGDLLVLFYAGHGYKDDEGQGYFASYDSDGASRGWAMAEIPRVIEAEFRGDRALLLADACYSGVLAREVKQTASRVSYAVFTSSSASASSTGNWTFTEALLDGLRGAPGVDANRDGAVTLAETATHLIDDMAIGEEQLATFTTVGTFSPASTLAVAGPSGHARVGQRVEAMDEGEWWKARIVAVRSGALKLHWLGIQGYEDQWVDNSLVRALRPPRIYPPGTRLEAEWEGEYFKAKVLEVKRGIHLIHYDDHTDDWDEWVPSSRLRPLR